MIKTPCDEAVILTSPEVPCLKKAQPWILTTTILASSMAFIDGTVVNVALPALQAEFSATLIDVQWVVESYALFLAALLLVGGSSGDHFGRRLIFAIGVVVFALSSAACGMAQSIDTLIVARAFQGIGAALLIPGSLAIIGSSFSEEERGRAIGTWSGAAAITAAIGPVLGGWLIEHYSWRAAFLINLPLAAMVLILVKKYVPESKNADGRSGLDWKGAVCATLGLGSLVYGLMESSNSGWSHPAVLFTIVGGVLILCVFLFLEARARAPMLPLHLFRSKNFTGANLLTFFLYAGLGGALFFFPLNLIQVQDYSATAAGAAFLPFTFILFFLSRWSGGLINRYGARMPLIAGPLLTAAGFVLFAVPSVNSNYWTTFFPAVTVLGIGMAISIAPLTTTVMNSVHASQSGTASGINNAVARTAGLLAVAIFGAIILSAFSKRLDERLSQIAISSEVRSVLTVNRSQLAALRPPPHMDGQTREVVQHAIETSFVSGFRLIMLAAAILALISALIAWLTIESRPYHTQSATQDNSE